MTRECAADMLTCARLSPAAMKALCKAKGITGYTSLQGKELVDTCCKEGGMSMPENFNMNLVRVPKSELVGKTREEKFKIAFKKLLKEVKERNVSADVGSKRSICIAGDFPDYDYYKFNRLLESKGALSLGESGKLVESCVKKCLDKYKNQSCGVTLGKPAYSGDRDKEHFAFFGNYLTGIPAMEMSYKSCKNKIDLFWDVTKKMKEMTGKEWGCEKGDLSCSSTIAGSGWSYNSRNLSMSLNYGCKDNSIRLDFTSVSDKYDYRAYGATEYDQPRYDIDTSKIEESDGIKVPDSEVKRVFGNKIKNFQSSGPDFQWQDKSFDVVTRFVFTYPALNTVEDANDLVSTIRSARSILGRYV